MRSKLEHVDGMKMTGTSEMDRWLKAKELYYQDKSGRGKKGSFELEWFSNGIYQTTIDGLDACKASTVSSRPDIVLPGSSSGKVGTGKTKLETAMTSSFDRLAKLLKDPAESEVNARNARSLASVARSSKMQSAAHISVAQSIRAQTLVSDKSNPVSVCIRWSLFCLFYTVPECRLGAAVETVGARLGGVRRHQEKTAPPCGNPRDPGRRCGCVDRRFGGRRLR